jgi:uncharacterized membrane protein YqiK
MLASILVPAVIAVVALVVIGLVMTMFYKRASRDFALVRSGLGGPKVVIAGGMLVMPGLQEVTKVSLTTSKLTISRGREDALVTSDKMRVDVTVEFYVRVAQEREAVSIAAQTLGKSVNDQHALKELIEGKVVGAMRTVTAEKSLEELHVNRSDFVQRVQAILSEDLKKNGLELETASLVGLSQTSAQYINADDNTWDAEGATLRTRITQQRAKERFEIEQQTSVEIETRRRDAEMQKLSLTREVEQARLSQEAQLAQSRAETEAQIAANAAAGKLKSEQARIESERAISESDIQRNNAVQLANQRSEIEVAKQSEQKSAALAKAAAAQAEAAQAEEKIATARQVEIANREKQVQLVRAEQEAEQKAIGVRVAAEAEKQAAEQRSEAVLIEAKAASEAELLKAAAKQKTYEVDAEGSKRLNEARNVLTPGVLDQEVRLKAISQVATVLEAATKPMEKIESIKIVQMGGMDSVIGAGRGVAANDMGGLPDQIVTAALKNAIAQPLVKDLMKSAGFTGDALVEALRSPVAAAVATVPAATAAPAAGVVDLDEAPKPAAAAE